MHELSLVLEIVHTVEQIKIEQNLNTIHTIVLQIGNFSSILPKNIEEFFFISVKGTSLEKSKLEIEICSASGQCRNCKNIFEVKKLDDFCPKCYCKNFSLISGFDLIIKEIHAN